MEVFNYDNVSKSGFLKGWVFSNKGKVKIKIEGDYNFEFTEEKRPDVYNAFDKKSEFSYDSGFMLDLKDISKKDIINLTFFVGDDFIQYKIDMISITKSIRNKKIYNLKKYFSSIYFKEALKYFKVYGIKATIRKIINTIKNRNKNVDVYNEKTAYTNWILNNENYNISKVKEDIENFNYNPTISIVLPVYNVGENWLRKCIDSVTNQYYEKWELCIADDCSNKPHIKKVLSEYESKDKRIKVIYRDTNGHISEASNSALSLSTGDFIGLLDNDDELSLFALYEVVKCLNINPKADLIYSDEDKIDEQGNRSFPHFKPDWSPDTLLSCNYITHFSVFRKTLIDKIGGFRKGYEGAQDYDIILRATENIPSEKIIHISKILYHWRTIEGSTATISSGKNYAYEAGFRALEDMIKRRGYNAIVNKFDEIPYYDVEFIPSKEAFVSIIIPTKDKSDLLKTCIDSIFKATQKVKFEIIIIDNNSEEEATKNLFEHYSNNYENITVLTLKIPFNYSKLNNEAVKIAKGNLLLFLNNDTEVISKNWLEILAGQAERDEVGIVGAKLLYPNNTIQHAGVVLGIGGVAGHVHLQKNEDASGYYSRLKLNYNYSAVTGACLMVKKNIFEDVCGLDEDLQVAFNDVDFCIKVMSKGFYNIYLSKVKLYHYESISRGKDDTLEKMTKFQNECYIMKNKWNTILENDPFYNKNLSLVNHDFEIRSDSIN